MKKMITMIIALMLAMIPTAAYAGEQAEDITPKEEMEVAATEQDNPGEEAVGTEIETTTEDPEVPDASEAEISPLTGEIPEAEEESEEEEISSEMEESGPEEPAEDEYVEPTDSYEEDLFIDEECEAPSAEEETPIYEIARVYVAKRAKKGTVDISSFGFTADEEGDLAAYLSMSFDDFYIVEQDGILVAVVIGEMDDADETVNSIYVDESEEAEDTDERAEATSVASAASVENIAENEEGEESEPIGFLMTILILLAAVVKNAVTLL